jgi:alkaline phosphatase D
MSSMNRRGFLRVLVVSASAGGTGLLSACVEEGVKFSTDPADRLRVFPQGMASGDPKPDSVILWTRTEPEGEALVAVTYEVATDEAFSNIVAQGDVNVDDTTDHTLRIKVTALSPFTVYYYRFIAHRVISETGRTKTAPSPDQDVPVRFAFAACQDYNGRYYHAWRVLAEQEEVDFVVHLGDYIYETEGDPRFQEPTDQRRVTLPEGLVIGSEEAPYSAALTLADYRYLYRTYRSDPDLQLAHRLFPFINIWDDHEFADDSWQDHSTHFNEEQGDEKNPERRHAASQAWFEYQPADLELAFDGAAAYPGDIKIYRTLRYGAHMELVLTDQRYYRADHVIPEGPADPGVGKPLPNTGQGSRNFVIKLDNATEMTEGFDTREAAVKPTMLGADQKQWLIDTVTGSTATWKFWGNETQLAQMLIDLRTVDLPNLPESYRTVFYFTVDQWDGYRSERERRRHHRRHPRLLRGPHPPQLRHAHHADLRGIHGRRHQLAVGAGDHPARGRER